MSLPLPKEVAVGILANPSSGQDVRRLVSQAVTVTSLEKINVLSRVLAGLEVMGVRHVLYMRDRQCLVRRAWEQVAPHCELQAAPVDAPVEGSFQDTLEATKAMVGDGVAALITLGGDGTNRLVARHCEEVPLMPLSTGTNNVFPKMLEGTRVGMAVGILAASRHEGLALSELCSRHKMLRAATEEWEENALIDLAVSRNPTLGGRAIWEADRLERVFVTRANTGASGLSGIVGAVSEVGPQDKHGAFVTLGDRFHVKALLTAGVVQPVGIEEIGRLEPGEPQTCFVEEGTLLADGERVRQLRRQSVAITLSHEGPWVLDVPKALAHGLRQGHFRI